EGYIPRPANSFMLFRSECCKLQREGKLVVKTSQQDISKVAAEIWATLPMDQKDYWVQMAKLAEAEHKSKHPGYTYK
ncbi:high mobility group box domain-containing protein, partial [Crucibulum laeve]